MIFKRRDKRGLLARVGEFLAPRKGWRRGFEYIGRRVQRLPDTPHRIALGFACGAAASFTPLFGLHFIVALAIAFAVRGNLLASALGTVVGNPLTFPAIAAGAIACGDWIAGTRTGTDGFDPGLVFRDYGAFLDSVFVPYLLGGLPLGSVAGITAYLVVRPIVAAYQRRRRSKLMIAAKRRMMAHLEARAAKKAAQSADRGG